MSTLYFGYPTHTDWLAVVIRSEPVNALSVIEPGRPNSYGMAVDKQVIVLSQVQGQTVHYFRVPIEAYQTINGAPAGLDEKTHSERAKSAWAILQIWLGEQGLRVRRAIVAFPKTARLLDGSADGLMEFNRAIGLWMFADRIDPRLLEGCAPAPVAQEA